MARGAYPPAEIWLDFAGGEYLFRLGAAHIAALQDARGTRVAFPDGSTGKKPKPLGAIWREHTQIMGMDWIDGAAPDFDPLDSREIIRLGLIGGGAGRVKDLETGETKEIKVDGTTARTLIEDEVDPWPALDKWRFALAILRAVCIGYDPEDAAPGKPEAPTTEGETANSSSTSAEQSET